VRLHNPRRIEPGLLEVSIHIAREDERARRHRIRPFFQDREARVRLGLCVQVPSMSVEAPGKTRVFAEPYRVGDMLERQPKLCERRIGAPEPVAPAEVRQARVHAHARAGTDQQAIRRTDRRRRGLDFPTVIARPHRSLSTGPFCRSADNDLRLRSV
jgi:hypothetical protein